LIVFGLKERATRMMELFFMKDLPILIQCPKCKEIVAAQTNDAAGQTVSAVCPKCNEQITGSLPK